MKIIVTGSLGHISKPLTQALVEKGHGVTVVSSNSEKQSAIEALGAVAAIGSLQDAAFLTSTFTNADAVYTMVPPANYFDHTLDLLAHYRSIGSNYAKAIQASGVLKVVNLGTIGGHLEKESGILLGAHHVEEILNGLPPDIAITHMRPTSFFYNLYGFTTMIKSKGFMAANYGADKDIPWVAPTDIAAAIAEEFTLLFNSKTSRAERKIRYVVSEEVSGNETASIIGAAIGKPDLKWLLITSEEMKSGLITAGMNPLIAGGLVEMYASLYNGVLSADYYRNKPAVMGKVKLADFAKEFAAAYHQL